MYQHVSNIHTCIQRQYVLLQSGFVTELSVAFLSSLTLSLLIRKVVPFTTNFLFSACVVHSVFFFPLFLHFCLN